MICSLQRRWLLPVWLTIVWLLDWRAGPGHLVIPVALLAGVGVATLYERLPLDPRRSPRLTRAGAIVLALALFRTLLGGWVYEHTPPPALTLPERTAMRWAASNTMPDARFAVVSGTDWAVDYNAEWFPALTRRVSVSTVQGTEWAPGVFFRLVSSNEQLQRCGSSGAHCLERWLQSTGNRIDYVYVAAPPAAANSAGGCCTTLRESLAGDAHYQLVFSAGGTTIFRRLRSAAPTAQDRAPRAFIGSVLGQGPMVP